MEHTTSTKHHKLNAFTFNIRTKGWRMLTMTIGNSDEWYGRTERDAKGRVIVYLPYEEDVADLLHITNLYRTGILPAMKETLTLELGRIQARILKIALGMAGQFAELGRALNTKW